MVTSLLHDDVIDGTDLGAASAHAAFRNKYAILGGNFWLGQASAALSLAALARSRIDKEEINTVLGEEEAVERLSESTCPLENTSESGWPIVGQ
jgi:geranylgeranyl pyrophosphate synthase